jgi:hypothetical protein
VAEWLGEEIEAVEVEEVSRGEMIGEIDREARERLGMSFDQFYECYRNGDLPDTLVVNELVILLRFAGLGDRASA